MEQAELDLLIQEGHNWILGERNRFKPLSRPLAEEEQREMAEYFEPDTLAVARVADVPEIDEPSFLRTWRDRGVPGILDFQQVAGITYVDTIVVARKFSPSGERWLSLLFHELVHVAQWRVLTPERMILEYVQGWADNGFNYYRIPFEVQAYEFQLAHDRKESPFSVEGRVREAYGS